MKKSNLLLLLSLLLLISILKKIGFLRLLRTIKTLDPRFLFLAVLMDLIGFMVWNLKFKKVAEDVADIRYVKFFPVLMAGSFANTITPGARTGGGIVMAHYLSEMSEGEDTAFFASNVIDKATITASFSFFAIYSILTAFLFLNLPNKVKILLESFLLILVLVILSGYVLQRKAKNDLEQKGKNSLTRHLPKIYHFKPFDSLRRRFKTYLSFEEYVINKIDQFTVTLKNILKDREKINNQLIMGTVVWLLIFTKAYILFQGFGLKVNFLEIVVVITLSILISYLFIVPGGMGVVETAMISLYAIFGINSNIAAAVTLLDRAIYYFFSLGIGYVSLLYLQIKYK